MIPVALAILLTFLLAPMVGQLQRWGIHRGLSVSLVVLLTALLLGGTIWLATMQIRNLADELPQYRANMRQKISDLRELQKSSALDRLNDMLGEVRGELSKDDKTSVPKPSAEAGRRKLSRLELSIDFVAKVTHKISNPLIVLFEFQALLDVAHEFGVPLL